LKPSLAARLDGLDERVQEISALLADATVIADQPRFLALAREHAELDPLVGLYRDYLAAGEALEAARALADDDASEMRALANEEARAIEQRQGDIERQIQTLLIPADPGDQGNVSLEIRAGTGGDEATLFATDLYRMYTRYAERRGWTVETVSHSDAGVGGFREVVLRMIGRGAYSRLKFESGGHRVQRVPETESQGRIHTSACTVAVLPEADEITEVELHPGDLRIDTFRASGAGGQHVNKTDSAIRITHLPTGTVVECQDERSQHKNRARAMSLLRARLLAAEQHRQTSERAETRRLLVGSGDRSQRIRTYNFPQGRVTEHRINLTLYKLADVLDGDLDSIIEALIGEDRAERLAALAD